MVPNRVKVIKKGESRTGSLAYFDDLRAIKERRNESRMPGSQCMVGI